VGREWREGVVGAAGLLTLVSGYLPWWVVRLGSDTIAGSAWRMSSRWTASIVLTVAAAAAWLAWKMARGRVPIGVLLGSLAAVALAIVLTVQQRRDVEPWPPTDVQATAQAVYALTDEVEVSDAEFARSYMPRNHLRRYRDQGTDAGPGYGFWTGLAAMTSTALSLTVAGRGNRPPA